MPPEVTSTILRVECPAINIWSCASISCMFCGGSIVSKKHFRSLSASLSSIDILEVFEILVQYYETLFSRIRLVGWFMNAALTLTSSFGCMKRR